MRGAHASLRGRGRRRGCVLGIEGLAAAFAIDGFGVVPFGHAGGACAGGWRLSDGAGHFCGEDAGGDDDEGVADEDEEGGEELADGRCGGDVAVADGGHGDDGPVHGAGHRVEGCVAGVALDDVHERARDEHDDQHGGEEDGDFVAAEDEGAPERGRFGEVSREFEDTEDAQEAERADDEEPFTARDEEAQERGEDGEKIDYAEEGCRVSEGTPHDKEACGVLGGEKQREGPFEGEEGGLPGLDAGARERAEDDDGDGSEDGDDKRDVEGFAGWRVGFENDLVNTSAPPRVGRGLAGVG